jgi:aldehyde:ferredoxin oxidoreductase
MYGFHNKILHVDVGQRSFKEEFVEDDIYRQFLGGKGLATYLLLKYLKPGIDPLSEDNIIIFAGGPITSTQIWGSSRYGVFTKSPLTQMYCESYAGGSVAEPLDRTGYDAIIIKGASSQPLWVEVSNNCVKFHDASFLWGKDTYESEYILSNIVGEKRAGIAVIGLAGQNLVRFACIENNYWRSAGRSGTGAVLGSKKIKALVFYGEAQKGLAHPEMIEDFSKEIAIKAQTDPGAAAYRRLGTPMLVAATNKIGAFPTRYWSSGRFERWPNISADALLEKCKVKSKACPRCVLACGKLTEIIDGRHKGLILEGPEYETIYAFGGLCLVDDIREIVYLNDICDRLGIDTITAGNLAAFTIEAGVRKDISEKIEYGDADGIAELLYKIAKREGIGSILANGIKFASREWGLEDLAIHVKGLEPPGYDPRVLKGMGLVYATSDRGACHLRSTVYKAEISGMSPPDQVNGKAEVVIDYEDRHTLFDALIICRFFRDMYPWDTIARIIDYTTGIRLNKTEMQKLATDITNLAREFNLREGLKREDDCVPERFFEEKLQDSGKIIVRGDFEKMLSDYYRLKRWGP